MTISVKSWLEYINALKKVDTVATTRFAQYLGTHNITTQAEIDAMLEYAFGISTKYGEAAAELACEMFESVAKASGVAGVIAEPAATATMSEVAKQVIGTRKNSKNIDEITSSVGRLVKMANADTMLKNASKYGAEFAWIPHGDTCAFCIMLASNGWRKQSKSAMNGNHAEHIHSRCDCNYAVRFNPDTKYQDYDPERYKKQYDDAEGDTWQEKLNSMRREYYAENKEEINEQKRSAYEKRVEKESSRAEETFV